jgi:hypothetical protein
MIMKRKYIAAIVASVGLLALAASVTAQQDAASRQPAKSADLAPVVSDLAPVVRESMPRYQLDVEPQANMPAHTLYSAYGQNAWQVTANPQRVQFMQNESALAQQVEELKHRLDGAATDADRSKVRTQLSELLGKQFDIRQKRHGLEIESLESQVKKLKDMVRKRNESRDEIISRRVDQILREAEGLGW